MSEAPWHNDTKRAERYAEDGDEGSASDEDDSQDYDDYSRHGDSRAGGGGPASSSGTPSKTGKKRGRHMVSCAGQFDLFPRSHVGSLSELECRRLKLRCDRQGFYLLGVHQ